MQKDLLTDNEKISSVEDNEWAPESRFSVGFETATLSEMELADYCRRMDIFIGRVKDWRMISVEAHEMKMTGNLRADKVLREARNRLHELEQELLCKDKALAEAAALLILREKFNAFWDNSKED